MGEGESFEDFIAHQVSAGNVPPAAAQKILSEIAQVGDGQPILSPSGWRLPSLSQTKP